MHKETVLGEGETIDNSYLKKSRAKIQERTNLEKEFGNEANFIYKSHKKQVKLVKPDKAFLERYKVGIAKSVARP